MNNRIGILPTLWLLVSMHYTSVSVYKVEEQQINIKFTLLGVSSFHYLTFVYASVFYKIRRRLWNAISDMSALFTALWSLIGDFNAVFSLHEKSDTDLLKVFYVQFRNAIEDANLVYVDSRGFFFTWTRKCLSNSVESKLDRVFCSQACIDLWDNILV